MSFFLNLVGAAPPQPAASAWTNPAWWSGGTLGSVAGVDLSPETALKISTVYACVSLLAETIAGLPLVMYRWLENQEGRERARNHPLYDVLHDQPNERQTAFEFVEMLTAYALLRGSGRAIIRSGPRGFADQLMPIHPDRIERELLTNGRYRYIVQEESGGRRTYNQEDIFDIGGLSWDGINTVSVVSYARDSLGLSLAAERYGSRFFRNDSRPGGVLSTDQKLTKDTKERLKAQWEAAHSVGNQNRVAVLEQGLSWQQVGISPEEAQFLGTREFQAEDVCRWFRVPPHMVGLTSKATSWGTGIEQLSIGFVTYTLRPWLTRWTQAIRRDLILAPNTYFADFVIESLLRGDVSSRYNAYAIARQWGWLSVNDIRQLENMNPVDDGDIYLTPMNMSPAGQSRQAMADNPHYRLLAEEAAGRLVRKEVMAMGKASERAGANREAWGQAVLDFYTDHAGLVAQTMRVSLDLAESYCRENQRELLTEGYRATADWHTRRVSRLADMVVNDD